MTLPAEREVRPVLLAVLASLGGEATPGAVIPLLTTHFAIEPDDLALTLADGHIVAWPNRIAWARNRLAAQGLIDRTTRGVWKLTETGWQTAKEPEATPIPPGSPDNDPTDVADGTASPVVASLSIEDELRAAATDFLNSVRLEHACASAFRALGFDAETIGGAGNTDVVVTAPLGVNQYTLVVDAKSTGRGRVTDAQVDWLSIRQHRDRLKADYACVVGTAYGGGHLIERATEFGIVLISVEEFCELLALHREAPFALTELRSLFESAPLARVALPKLRAVARDRRRFQLLVHRILGLVDNFNRVQPDLVIARPETLQALILASGDQSLSGATRDEVAQVLALLEAAGILRFLDNGGFASMTSVAGALSRLASLLPRAESPSEPESGDRETAS